jgi:hypothetical protein
MPTFAIIWRTSTAAAMRPPSLRAFQGIGLIAFADQPRPDVLKGTIQESDFAADLAQVLRGDAPEEYEDPAKFLPIRIRRADSGICCTTSHCV